MLLAFVLPFSAQKVEDYRVYDAVIHAMFRGGVTRFDMNARVDNIVIRDRTYSEYTSGLVKENWDQVKLRLRALSDDTLAGYESARKSEVKLESNLNIPIKYQLIGDKELATVFPKKNQWDKSAENWNDFYRRYPGSAGYNSFSRVGYDKARGYALVYFVNWCGPLCGTGTYLLVEKRPAGWAVKETAQVWIS